MTKDRNISIDILKFIAALLITNSHMELLYGKYSYLATGGAIGDVLFFFCSGFTLFLGRLGRFDNWYKRRINRIYPTVFAWAILGCWVFNHNNDIIHTLLHGGGWFVSCIMIYYAILYFIRKYVINHLGIVMILTAFLCLIWYLLMDRPKDYNMYGKTYFKWGFYFLFMLFGSIIGLRHKMISRDEKGLRSLVYLIIAVIIYYVIIILRSKFEIVQEVQIISLLPLFVIVFYFFKVCNCDFVHKCFYSKITGWVIKLIGGLCLEIYLVQYSLFTDKMNSIFPFNLLIIFIVIVFVAYILRCLSRVFSQTFNNNEYNWNEVFKIL